MPTTPAAHLPTSQIPNPNPTSEISPSPAPLLPLAAPDESALLALILNNFDIFQAASDCRQTPAFLIAFSTRPDIAAYLAAYRALTNLGLERSALDTLSRLLSPPHNATKQLDHHKVESRRSATTILRAIRSQQEPRASAREPSRPAPIPPTTPTRATEMSSSRATEMSSSRCALSPHEPPASTATRAPEMSPSRCVHTAPATTPTSLHTTAGKLPPNPSPSSIVNLASRPIPRGP
ncbi:MAG TPA: hypothetical protein VD997_10040 [Phycisphaerales bacterium]|nr:hypothetical protein [Phycisphaerales bacterium]